MLYGFFDDLDSCFMIPFDESYTIFLVTLYQIQNESVRCVYLTCNFQETTIFILHSLSFLLILNSITSAHFWRPRAKVKSLFLFQFKVLRVTIEFCSFLFSLETYTTLL